MLTVVLIGGATILASALLSVAWVLRESWLGDVIREVGLQIIESGIRLVFEIFKLFLVAGGGNSGE